MTRKTCLHIREATVAAMACLVAVACSPKQGEFGDQLFPHGTWEQIPPAPENMVEVVTLHHMVGFADTEEGLSYDALSDLQSFIRDNRISIHDEIGIQPYQGQGDHMTMARLTAIKAEFARHGLVAAETMEAPATVAPTAPGEVAVLVTRAVVVPPDCAQPQPGPVVRPGYVWGCHTNTALGMMVANPQDLVEGEALGPADGEQSTGAVRRYRSDSVKAIKAEGTN